MLEGQKLSFSFARSAPTIFSDVDLRLEPGEIVGLSGPSGIGKSTLARVLCGHLRPTSGSICIDGQTIPTTGFHPIQLLTQTPIFSLNPRWTIGKILSEAGPPDAAACRALQVSSDWLDRYPHELSGGELQRVSLARALGPEMRYLVADEITAMLDPITQAQIWTYLMGVARERRIGILAISHDQALLSRVAGRTMGLQ